MFILSALKSTVEPKEPTYRASSAGSHPRPSYDGTRAQKPPIPISGETVSKRVLSAQPRYQPIRIDDIMAKAGTLTWVLSFISIKFYKIDYLILKSKRISQCNSKNSKHRRSWDAVCFHLPLYRMFSFQEFELGHFASISEILQGWENKEVCSTYVPTNNLRIYGKWKMIAKRRKIRKTTQQCVARKKGNQNNPEKYTSSANKILSLFGLPSSLCIKAF